MKCESCQYDNEADALYCEACGVKLPLVCSECGTALNVAARFCRKCGTPTTAVSAPTESPQHDASSAVVETTESEESPSEPPPDGERKTVTVLFADIKGSMELIEDLDPEDARAVVDPALKLMMDAVHHYDGYVAQSTGDGIFALFGAPVAREDHPQRALYAALRMQEELKRYSNRIRAEGRLPMQGRVGVNTGEVVVRSIQTGAAQTDYTPVGHSTSLAARMQALAPIGSIATTDAVRRLCEGYFQFRDLGPTRVKGVSELINIFEVIGLGPLRTRLQRSVGRGLTKFVGREREMDTLKRTAELARTGHGQIVAAIAEAGTGKSRLFFEFEAISRSGWMVLETVSVSHGKASAYLPLIDMLHSYFGIDAADGSRQRREKVAGKIAILDRAMENTLPTLFDLLGIADDVDSSAPRDEQAHKRRTLEAIKQILLRESLNQPLMVIFEDLHWIDEHTQDFLNLLADSIGTAKLLLLVNYRPEYSHQWNSKTYYTQLRLDPLGREGAGEMLSALLGDGDDLSALKQLIVEKTEGTPFFMEEMVQDLFEEGTLIRDGTVQLTRALGELEIPVTVQAILATRIDRLPGDAKELLQVLAVIGRELPLPLIRSLVVKSDDELERLLDELQLGEFIYEQPAVGDPEYVFKHALTQDVAYHSVLLERRKDLHGSIGKAIETLYADSIDDRLVELAHHYGRSGNVDAGAKYVSDAAKQKMDEARRVDGKLADILVAGAHSDVRPPPADVTRPSADEDGSVSTQESAEPDFVDSIWRFPVKSMGGEEISATVVTERGFLGDRTYALVDRESNRAATLRTWAAALLDYHPQFLTEPEPGAESPDMRITLPDGSLLTTTDGDVDQRLSAPLNRDLSLMATAPVGLTVEFPAGTLGGKMSNVTDVPIASAAPPGAFFDYGCVHLLSSATLEFLQSAYPTGQFDVRRFRPNIMIRSHGEPFVENAWVGRAIAIGEEVIFRVTIPCPRCSTVTLPQGSLPRDPRILRTVAEHNMLDLGEFGSLPCAGVYADVEKTGVIRRGDEVRYLD